MHALAGAKTLRKKMTLNDPELTYLQKSAANKLKNGALTDHRGRDAAADFYK